MSYGSEHDKQKAALLQLPQGCLQARESSVFLTLTDIVLDVLVSLTRSTYSILQN